MKIEFKSLFLGILFGVFGVLSIFYLLGKIQTDFSYEFEYPNRKTDKNIEVHIEQTIVNDEESINILLKGTGEVTKQELEEELERVLDVHGINRKTTKMNIEMDIKN